MTTALNTPDNRSSSPMVAVPRVAPQRRWRPLLVWLGVAMVISGGLGNWRLFTTYGHTEEYLAVGRAIDSGVVVTRDDLTTVRISRDPSLKPIAAADVNRVVGQRAAMALPPGTLLTEGQLTKESLPGAGQQLIGISLPTARVPAQRIKAGATVLLVVTTSSTTPGQPTADERTAPPTSIQANVVDVRPGVKDDETHLNVVVAERDGPLVASRAAEGRIVVLLTKGN